MARSNHEFSGNRRVPTRRAGEQSGAALSELGTALAELFGRRAGSSGFPPHAGPRPIQSLVAEAFLSRVFLL